MSDVKLQDWPEGKRLRITYCHGKDEPRAITSYAGKWHFFEPVRVEIEPHPEGFYIPARDYDRQAAEITRLRDLVKETGDLAALRAAEITRLCAELTTARREGMEEAAKKALVIARVLSSPSAQNALRSFADAIRAAAKEGKDE